jgi:hypothetical protein
MNVLASARLMVRSADQGRHRSAFTRGYTPTGLTGSTFMTAKFKRKR